MMNFLMKMFVICAFRLSRYVLLPSSLINMRMVMKMCAVFQSGSFDPLPGRQAGNLSSSFRNQTFQECAFEPNTDQYEDCAECVLTFNHPSLHPRNLLLVLLIEISMSWPKKEFHFIYIKTLQMARNLTININSNIYTNKTSVYNSTSVPYESNHISHIIRILNRTALFFKSGQPPVSVTVSLLVLPFRFALF